MIGVRGPPYPCSIRPLLQGRMRPYRRCCGAFYITLFNSLLRILLLFSSTYYAHSPLLCSSFSKLFTGYFTCILLYYTPLLSLHKSSFFITQRLFLLLIEITFYNAFEFYFSSLSRRIVLLFALDLLSFINSFAPIFTCFKGSFYITSALYFSSFMHMIQLFW